MRVIFRKIRGKNYKFNFNKIIKKLKQYLNPVKIIIKKQDLFKQAYKKTN